MYLYVSICLYIYIHMYVLLNTLIIHGIHTDESCRRYACVMSQIRKIHITHTTTFVAVMVCSFMRDSSLIHM